MTEQTPEQRQSSEILTIMDTEAYWGIGRMGCHDIVERPASEFDDRLVDGEVSFEMRGMRSARDPETGLWSVYMKAANSTDWVKG